MMLSKCSAGAPVVSTNSASSLADAGERILYAKRPTGSDESSAPPRTAKRRRVLPCFPEDPAGRSGADVAQIRFL